MTDGRDSGAYLITFACYGQHLHGDARGSVDRFHNQPGSRLRPESESRQKIELGLMKEPAYRLDRRARRLALDAIREACRYREWMLDACHVRTNHVHVVVTLEGDPEKAMNAFKVYAGQALNRAGEERSKRWARHGSIKDGQWPGQSDSGDKIPARRAGQTDGRLARAAFA